MPPTKTWKSVEAKIARYFLTKRTPLSGGNSGHTRSDTLHRKLFVEAKHRVKHSAVTLWDGTKQLATKENKTPVVCLNEKGRPGFWILVHSEDLETVAQERKIAREVEQKILEGKGEAERDSNRDNHAVGGQESDRGWRLPYDEGERPPS